jgi:hypothetical protein
MIVDATEIITAAAIAGLLLIVLADFGVWTWLRQQFHVPREVEWQQGVVSADAAIDAPSADQVYFAVAERLLDTQIKINADLDTRTAGTVTVGSTVLPLTFGLLSLSGRTLPDATQWLLIAAVVAYVILLMTAAWTSYIRGLEYRPGLSTLWQHSQVFDGAVLRRWVAEEYAVSGEINRLALANKARWVGRTTLLLYAEGILISAAAAAALIG